MNSEMNGNNESAQSWRKLCRKCSVQSDTDKDFCPNCGATYLRRRTRRPGRKVVAAVAAIVLAGGAVSAVALVMNQRKQAEDQRIEQAADKRQAQRASEEAENAAAADDAERAMRETIIKAMQKSITKDAKKTVDDGLLDGPILYTTCTPLGGGSTDDLTAVTGTFECIAATTENNDGTVEGYRYSATAKWADGSYTWHLGA